MTPARLTRLALGACVGLSALASPLSLGPARAEPPAEPTARIDTTRWREALTAFVPADCAATLAEFLTPTGDTWTPPPGAELPRTAPQTAGVFLRLNATGGLPYWGMRDALVRRRSVYDAELAFWRPARDDSGAMNRGYALWSPAPGRDLLVVDHMRSPISSATSIWEQVGQRVVERAQFPAEIVTLEDRPTEIVVHATDTFNAVALAWDKPAGAFVGRCLVGADSAASSAFELGPVVLATTPRVSATRAPAKLLLQPPSAPPIENVTLAKIPRGERVVVLHATEAGVFVLTPWRDRSPLTRLFRAQPDRLWQLGWLAPEALASP